MLCGVCIVNWCHVCNGGVCPVLLNQSTLLSNYQSGRLEVWPYPNRIGAGWVRRLRIASTTVPALVVLSPPTVALLATPVGYSADGTNTNSIGACVQHAGHVDLVLCQDAS